MDLWHVDAEGVPHPHWGSIILVSVSSIALVLVVWIAFASAIWGFGVATAGIYGRGEARKQIQSAEMRIPAYNHFFDLCASIQGNEAQIDALEQELEHHSSGSKDHARVLANIAGVTAARQRAIAQYNADARKDYTIGQFRDSDLPYQLDTAEYPEGGGTTCVY